MSPIRFTGRIVQGLGKAAGFTRQPRVREEFLCRVGIEPHPGTLNLRVEPGHSLLEWGRLCATPGEPIAAHDAAGCAARCYPVHLRGTAAAVVLPLVAGYPVDQVELIAPVSLRETLNLADGAALEVSVPVIPPVRAVIFDVDGTLVDSIGAYHAAASRAAADYDLRVPGDAVRVALNGGPPFWELVVPGPRRSPELYALLRAATLRYWPAVLAEQVGIFPGLARTIGRLRSAGLRLAIYTGSEGESLPPLDAAGLLVHFEAVLTARDVTNRKPHPDGLQSCLARLGLQPGEAVYVGDSVQDIEAARAAGMAAIGVLTGTADSALLSAAGAHRILPDHSRLPDLLVG